MTNPGLYILCVCRQRGIFLHDPRERPGPGPSLLGVLHLPRHHLSALPLWGTLSAGHRRPAQLLGLHPRGQGALSALPQALLRVGGGEGGGGGQGTI